MKFNKFSVLIILFLGLTIVSCEKEKVEDEIDETIENDNDSGNGDGGGSGDGNTNDNTIPNKVLIYHGNGGVGSEGMFGDMTHEETISMCSDSGLIASHSENWPSDLSVYRTIIIPAPGYNDNDAFYSTNQINDLKDFVSDGGYVLIEGENQVLDKDVINPLLSDLGFTVQMRYGNFNGTGDIVTQNSLTDGVSVVGASAYGRYESHSDNVLVKNSYDDLVIYKKMGSGYAIVTADGNMFSDLSDWDYQNKDNRDLLLNFLLLK